MGINYAGRAITNDEIVCIASFREILRRQQWYEEIAARGQGMHSWAKKCETLKTQALKYINEQNYDIDLKLT